MPFRINLPVVYFEDYRVCGNTVDLRFELYMTVKTSVRVSDNSIFISSFEEGVALLLTRSIRLIRCSAPMCRLASGDTRSSARTGY